MSANMGGGGQGGYGGGGSIGGGNLANSLQQLQQHTSRGGAATPRQMGQADPSQGQYGGGQPRWGGRPQRGSPMGQQGQMRDQMQQAQGGGGQNPMQQMARPQSGALAGQTQGGGARPAPGAMQPSPGPGGRSSAYQSPSGAGQAGPQGNQPPGMGGTDQGGGKQAAPGAFSATGLTPAMNQGASGGQHLPVGQPQQQMSDLFRATGGYGAGNGQQTSQRPMGQPQQAGMMQGGGAPAAPGAMQAQQGGGGGTFGPSNVSSAQAGNWRQPQQERAGDLAGLGNVGGKTREDYVETQRPNLRQDLGAPAGSI